MVRRWPVAETDVEAIDQTVGIMPADQIIRTYQEGVNASRLRPACALAESQPEEIQRGG